MNAQNIKQTNKNLSWVLASANEIIEESIYHCETFSHTLNAHHNPEAADVFSVIQQRFEEEQNIVLDKIKGIELQDIPPWEVPHQDYEHPASVLQEASYLMTVSEAWKITHEMIQVHTCFYNHLLENSSVMEIQKLVESLLKHCHYCQQTALIQYQNLHQDRQEDFDPPNIQG